MKKRVFGLLAACLIIACLLPVSAFATEKIVDEQVVYFADGSFMTTTIIVERTSVARATTNKTATIRREYKNGNGVIQWLATMTASFAYTGSTSSCTSVGTPVITIYDSDWCVVSKSAARDGDTAIGNITMGLKLLSGRINELPVTLTLSCDKNGNLS